MDEEFDTKLENITTLYTSALERNQNGERTISIDEMTGIQATERKEKDPPTPAAVAQQPERGGLRLPMRPGKVQRREFEYIRHGTQTLIANERYCHRSNY